MSASCVLSASLFGMKRHHRYILRL